MSALDESQVRLEIAHILFIDTVGYSKLAIEEQRSLIALLNQVVRSSPEFKTAEASGSLVRLPTGDGMALVFTNSPEAPVRCALEIARAVSGHPEVKLRMGIHSGQISRVLDVNDHSNIAGAGINNAQRVVSCADAGHILVSGRAAEDLADFPRWRPYLHELGECEVKHGAKLRLVNFYTGEVGNPELPAHFRPKGFKPRLEAVRRHRIAIGMVLTAVLIAGIFGFQIFREARLRKQQPAAVADKSIAVLPFNNLSDDKQNGYFADGIQDEILTDLAKVADLKVISRTSVMQYRSETERNLREIAKALNVAHILEGSVERIGNRVRVRTQLIDARNDSHIWAEQYDGDLADVFAIQSEVAERVVSQLQATLSPSEKAAIEQPPTTDLVAYDLYIRGKALVGNTTFESRLKENLLEGAALLEQSVARDPNFMVAFYQLARAYDQIYRFGGDHSPDRLAMAEKAAKTAFKLQPNSGEGHAAMAEYYYWCHRDYDRARPEVELAKRFMPNEPLPILLEAYMDRRQGRWDQSDRGLKRALELDPRNVVILRQIAVSYGYERRFTDLAAVLGRALTLTPDDFQMRVERAGIALWANAQTTELHKVIHDTVDAHPDAAQSIAETWLDLAACERDPAEFERAVAAVPNSGSNSEGIIYPRAWFLGKAARARGDAEAARRAFEAAREEVQKQLSEQPDYAEANSVLALIDAALERKKDAIREGRRAVDLLPVSKDAIEGVFILENVAKIYASTGEKDLALQELNVLSTMPSNISYGELRLHPDWDALRSDPRFEKIVASLAPKQIASDN
jgi:TolB-like protein/class 3 adenylate cyclase/Tfp pilus assembly protein PilF